MIPGIQDYPPRLPKGTIGEDVTLSDDLSIGGDITTVDRIQFNLVPPDATVSEGQIAWDADAGTVKIGLPGGVAIYQLGQELGSRVKNATASLITNGSVVRPAGASGNNPLIALADNASFATAQVAGFATEDIGKDKLGNVTFYGLVRGINTSHVAAGSLLWLGTNGDFTDIRPVAGVAELQVVVGYCLRSHATEGVVLAQVVFVTRMQYASDVYAPSISNGQILAYIAANSRFEPRTVAYMPVTEIDDTDSPYTVVTTDSVILCDTSSNPVTVNLRAVTDSENQALYIRNTSTNNVTIDGNGTELIDAAQTLVLASGEKTRIVPGSTQWWTVQ